MPSIKTRESLRTIKTFDRAKTLGQKVKNGAGEVKEYGEELQNTRYGSANEYAGNAVENTERRTARNVAYGAGKIGNWGLKETRKNILKWRSRPKKFKVKVQQPKQLPAPKRPALPPAKTTVKTAQKGVKAAQQTAKAAKTAKVTVKAAQKAAQAAKVAAKAAVKFAKVAAKAVVAAVKATVAAIKGIAAAIAAGGWIAVVVILLICMIVLVVGSVFGIFAPNPDNENSITIVQTVREANAAYEAQIAEIKSRYDYDMCFVSGEPCEWSLAIAVYAVKTNRTEDVVTFDEAKAEVLKEIYRRLNRMDVHTEQIAVKETHLETQEDGSIVPVEQEVVKTYLYIETVPLTAEEAANLYGFDTRTRGAYFQAPLSVYRHRG